MGCAAVVAAGASCLTEVPPPPPSPPRDEAPAAAIVEPLSSAPPMPGPKRPPVTAIPIDVASLPMMEPTAVEPGAGFTLYTQDVDPICPDGQTPRRYVGMGLRGELPPRTVLDIGGAHPPFAALDGKFEGVDDAITKARVERGLAVWTSVVPKDDAIDVTRYEGRFDDSRWRVVAKSKATVRPHPMVAGEVYGYRRGDMLGIIAPPTVWTSWSEKATPTSKRERFTLFEIPLHAGQGASLTLAYERKLALALHTTVATAEGPEALDLDAYEVVSIEVVWPSDGAAELTVYVGPANAHRDQLMGAPSFAGEGHCVALNLDSPPLDFIVPVAK